MNPKQNKEKNISMVYPLLLIMLRSKRRNTLHLFSLAILVSIVFMFATHHAIMERSSNIVTKPSGGKSNLKVWQVQDEFGRKRKRISAIGEQVKALKQADMNAPKGQDSLLSRLGNWIFGGLSDSVRHRATIRKGIRFGIDSSDNANVDKAVNNRDLRLNLRRDIVIEDKGVDNVNRGKARNNIIPNRDEKRGNNRVTIVNKNGIFGIDDSSETKRGGHIYQRLNNKARKATTNSLNTKVKDSFRKKGKIKKIGNTKQIDGDDISKQISEMNEENIDDESNDEKDEDYIEGAGDGDAGDENDDENVVERDINTDDGDYDYEGGDETIKDRGHDHEANALKVKPKPG